MALGGNAACILNAANEVTVQLFLEEKIGFTDIATLNGLAMKALPLVPEATLEQLFETDRQARAWVLDQVATKHI